MALHRRPRLPIRAQTIFLSDVFKNPFWKNNYFVEINCILKRPSPTTIATCDPSILIWTGVVHAPALVGSLIKRTFIEELDSVFLFCRFASLSDLLDCSSFAGLRLFVVCCSSFLPCISV